MASVSIYSYGRLPVDQDYASGLRKRGARLVAGELSESASSLRRRRNSDGDWSNRQTFSICVQDKVRWAAKTARRLMVRLVGFSLNSL